MKKILLPDTVKIINTAVNGYGDAVILDSANVKGAFFEGTAESFRNDTDLIEGYDAHCYVDETDPFVLENGYRLEGMYLVVSLYGYPEDESWYKIRDVKLGVTKIIDNVVNNCHCFLQKCDPLNGGDTPGQIVIGEVTKVDKLPELGHAGYIYLVPSGATTSDNFYDEYVWTELPDGTYGWELLGTRSTKLYDDVGDNTDGAMTQKATTDAIPETLEKNEYEALWGDKEN